MMLNRSHGAPINTDSTPQSETVAHTKEPVFESTPKPPAQETAKAKRVLKSPGPLTQVAIRSIVGTPTVPTGSSLQPATSVSASSPARRSNLQPAPTSSSTSSLLAAPAPQLDTVDAAQALLGLMHASPTSSVPESESPWGRDSSSGERLKRRKRAVEMTQEELLHARETNKKSAQQFRERERQRRMELQTKGESALRANEDLRKEIDGLREARQELAREIRRVMPSSPLLAPEQFKF